MHALSPGRRLARRFRPHAGRLTAAGLLVLVASAFPGAVVLLTRRVLDDVLIRHDEDMLALLAPGVVALYVLNGGVQVARGWLTRSVAWRVVGDLREELHAHLLRLDVAWHQRHPSGERLSRITTDVNNLQYAVNAMVTAVQKPVTLAVLVGQAFWLNASLAVVATAVLPLVWFPIDRFGKWVRAASRDALEASARLATAAAESFAGIRVVQVFAGEAQRMARFAALNADHERAQLRAVTAQLVPGPVVECIAALGVGAAIWLGGQQVFRGEITPGDLLGFLLALGLMRDPLKGLTEVSTLIQRALAAAESVFGLLDTPSALTDAGTREAPAPKSIALHEVDFDYGEGAVVAGVSFVATAGQRVAIVGASGAGKTTLLMLLARMRDPSGGAVRWDGEDLRDFSLATLRSRIAVVTQEAFLFDDSIAANIRFGRADATDAEVEAAATQANADAFIRAFPGGYATRVDELGMRLSGGQRQRICIARALVKGAPVLLLDEATSNLDAESEAAVQQALDRLMAGRTTFVVAHRLSTVREADHIVVLARGGVAEQGTHAALLARGGEYARLVARQAEG